MQKLPDLEEIESISEAESSRVKNSLEHTEDILKRLLVNIEAFKKIDEENKKLRSSLLETQGFIKETYKKKLDAEKDMFEKGKTQAKDVLDKYKVFSEKLTKELLKEKEQNKLLRQKYEELILVARGLSQDNKKLKDGLRETNILLKQEFQRRLKNIDFKLKEKELEHQSSHRSIIKEHESMKIELGKQLAIEKERNKFLKEKTNALFNTAKVSTFQAGKLEMLNKKLIERVVFLEKNSLANESFLKAKTEMIRQEFEKKLKEIAKEHLMSELEYKGKIESLTKDLMRYYDELKVSKEKYYSREKELKEKLKEFLD